MSTFIHCGLAFVYLACVGAIPAAHGATTSQAPIGKVIVHVDAGSRSVFFDRLKGFAEREAFAIRIAPTHPDGAHFLAQLWREDVKVIAANSVDADKFDVFFFLNSAHELPSGMLESMMGDLRDSVATPSADGIEVIEGSGS